MLKPADQDDLLAIRQDVNLIKIKYENDIYTNNVMNNKKYNNYERFVAYAHVIHIHVPKGAYGAYIGNHSSYQSEKEFLIQNDSVLELFTAPNVDHKNRRIHWKANLVHDGTQFTSLWKGKP